MTSNIFLQFAEFAEKEVLVEKLKEEENKLKLLLADVQLHIKVEQCALDILNEIIKDKNIEITQELKTNSILFSKSLKGLTEISNIRDRFNNIITIIKDYGDEDKYSRDDIIMILKKINTKYNLKFDFNIDYNFSIFMIYELDKWCNIAVNILDSFEETLSLRCENILIYE